MTTFILFYGIAAAIVAISSAVVMSNSRSFRGNDVDAAILAVAMGAGWPGVLLTGVVLFASRGIIWAIKQRQEGKWQ